MDWPARILGFAVKRMPTDLAEWGLGMQIELLQICNYRERWFFALSCAKVALFPPQRAGQQLRLWLTIFRNAGILSFLANVATILLRLMANPSSAQYLDAFALIEFSIKWFLLALIFTPAAERQLTKKLHR